MTYIAFEIILYIILTIYNNVIWYNYIRYPCLFLLFLIFIMKTPLNWISLYTPLQTLLSQQSVEELAHIYSIHTAEIDDIQTHSIEKIVIWKILQCDKHPESQKLSVCQVNIGNGVTETILTAAPNVTNATYVPVATVWAKLSPDFVIWERKMAGMTSRGMICGADEIWLARESDGGIMILENIWEKSLLENMIGQSVFDLTVDFPWIGNKIYNYTLWDTTFEIDNKFITNRPDLFGIYGNAREWGAIFDIDFKSYLPQKKYHCKTAFPLKISTDRCIAYHAIKMEDISVWTMPLGIQLMMDRSDLTTKMDIVDITNCILNEFGQPMHVFDADKVQGGIEVRLARPWETILALNDIEYILTEEDMIIADDTWPIAIAWVIGGKNSAVCMDTKSVIWESATFDANSIRLTAQRHNIRTDASTRYEKSLDPLLSAFVIDRVFDYLDFLQKNINITAMSSYVDESQINHIELEIDYNFISTKAGKKIQKKTILSILEKLWFDVLADEHKAKITVPSWRASKDISIEEDIVEEVLRIYGYDQIEPTPLNANLSISRKNIDHRLRDTALQFWKDAWWNEVYNYSFTNENRDKQVFLDDMTYSIGIQNAYNVEYTHMRRTLAIGLFENIAKNLKYQQDLQFFEIGSIYLKNIAHNDNFAWLLDCINPKPYGESTMIAGASTWDDISSLRKNIELFLWEIFGYIPNVHQENILPFLHPGISGEYRIKNATIVRFGRVHPEVVESFSLTENTLYWEMDMQALLNGFLKKETQMMPISKYPSITREINFVMNENVRTGDIAKVIEKFHPYIHSVIVNSVYADANHIESWKKSVNFAFMIQSHDHTISDEEALKIQDDIIDFMQKNHALKLRTL